ncbi:hypothetical protein COO60DRAFT_266104 [Scenedesmus sp. NREL 46B-D3]|nr:hypothetical protein COO60DRAFT_266104 [Scenedesmus sp. NREL 46B-D3]
MQQLQLGLGTLQGRQLQQRLICSSRYCLVAAAGSGNAQLLSELLQNMPQGSGLLVTQQLPAALQAAGRRGHVAALQVLLELQEMSARPLQLAAMHAAMHGWPAKALAALLQHMAARYRLELLLLLAKPLLLGLQAGNAAAAEAMLLVLQREACTEQPEVLRDVLLLLANQGQSQHVAWVLKVAPTVLVKLGQCAVAAALEGGHPSVAQQILDAGAERPAAFRAAAKRGQLVAAVQARDVEGVRQLLTEVTLPLVWTCEGGSGASGSSSSSSAVPAPAPAAVAAAAGGVLGQNGHAAAHMRSSAAGVSSSSVGCLLALLSNAADAGAPTSLQLLRLLLPALPPQQSSERQQLLLQLVQHCLRAGRCAELEVVLSSCCSSVRNQGRLLRELLLSIQLPDDETYLGRQPAAAAAAVAAAAPAGTTLQEQGPVAAAVLLLQRPGAPADMLSCCVANPYLRAAHPAEYLGAEVRPSLPAVFMPCKKGLTLLFRRLAAERRLPPGARVKDAALYKLMAQVVLQACSVDLLGAFLGFMEVHGEAMLAQIPRVTDAAVGVDQAAP